MSERNGDWMVTFSGRKFYPLDPRPEEIYIKDIAHALANMCRFTGHCKKFYSVAQHSVIVSKILGTQGAGPRVRLVGLLHDAHEAYLSDLSRPLKRSFDPAIIIGYNKACHIIDKALWEKYALTDLLLDPVIENWIKEADNIALYSEGRDLMRGGTKDWHDAENVEVVKYRITPLSPKRAERMFLKRFEELL